MPLLSDHHYNKTLEPLLQAPLLAGDADALVRQLSTLSRSLQRTAGYMLGERLLADCPAPVFWQMTEALVRHDSRAYLITLMKTFLTRLAKGTASLSDEAFLRLAASFNDVEKQKVLLLLMPAVSKPEDIEQLFRAMGIAQGHEQIAYLVRIDTPPCLFLLLRGLRHIEHDRQHVLQVARLLMKRGTGSSFNLASIIKVAFGLDELSGTFSLRLQPYEIARLENSYVAFCQRILS